MEGKDDLLIHAPISTMFSLFFLPLSIFFPFLCSFFLNLFYYCFYCGSLFSHFSLPSSNGSFLSPPQVPPLHASPPPFIYGYHPSLQWADSMGFLPFTPKVSPIVFGLLWTSLQDCPPIHWLLDHYHYQGKLNTLSFFHYTFHDKISLCLFLLFTSTFGFKWIRIKLPHHLPLQHASDCPNHLQPLLGKIPSQQGIFPKEVTSGNQIQTHFPPTTNPHPLNPLTMGPPLLYWLGTSWWCSTIFCFCLLSFPRCFCCSRLVLFNLVACLFSFL